MPPISDTQFVFFIALFVISYGRQWLKYHEEINRCRQLEEEINATKKG